MTGNRSVNAGRDIKSSTIATGDQAKVTSHYEKMDALDLSSDIETVLKNLRQVLTTIEGIDQKALTRLDEACAEAAKPDPDRSEVKDLVTQATIYAQRANGFAKEAENLSPRLMQVAAWMGEHWSPWARILGLQ